MATNSSIKEQKFNRKSGFRLLIVFETAKRRNVESTLPINIKTIKRHDKDSMISFIKKAFIKYGN